MYDGHGVHIYVLDTGIASQHADFTAGQNGKSRAIPTLEMFSRFIVMEVFHVFLFGYDFCVSGKKHVLTTNNNFDKMYVENKWELHVPRIQQKNKNI